MPATPDDLSANELRSPDTTGVGEVGIEITPILTESAWKRGSPPSSMRSCAAPAGSPAH
jgi:hypothetical protein